MSAVVEVVADTFQAVGDAVGAVAEVVTSAVQEVATVVEDTAKAVVATVEAVAEDPMKALPMIAVAVAAPYVAPYLWAGATTATAAAVLNTGIALAQGADPLDIAKNLAMSTVTQGIASELDLSTGYNFADKALGNAASAAIQGGDVGQAVSSSLGNSIVGTAMGGMTRQIRDFDYKNFFDEAINNSEMSDKDATLLAQGRIFEDGVNSGISSDEAAKIAKDFDPNAEEYVAYKNAPASEEEILNAEIFKDAIEHGFSQEEAAAIAKGVIEGQNPTVSNPVAGSSVTVEGYDSDVPETTSPITYASVSKEDLDKELGDGEIDQETYDALIKYASDLTESEQEYVDPFEESPIDATKPEETDLDFDAPEEESPIDATKPVAYGALNATTNEDGNTVYTYDDGSTLTMDSDNNVMDVTEATDYIEGIEETETDGAGRTTFDNALERAEDGDYSEYEYLEEADPKSKSGFSLKFGKPSGARQSSARTARSRIAPKAPSTSGSSISPTSSTGGLDSLGGGQYGVGLTSGATKGNTDYSLLGEQETEEPQGFASGGSSNSSTQGVYDLSTTAGSPFLGGGNSDIMALKPGTIKGKINYALPGYPFGQEWKAAKAGGSIQNAPKGHNPQFFSEGGLGKMKNTYVKGEGDGTSDSIAAMLANGEFVIPADVVSNLGNGSNDAGAKVLDEFLRTIRAHKRKANPKGLPPDSKGALGYLATAKKKVKK
jgi:hypothetical protein